MVVELTMAMLLADHLMWCECICDGVSERMNGQMN